MTILGPKYFVRKMIVHWNENEKKKNASFISASNTITSSMTFQKSRIYIVKKYRRWFGYSELIIVITVRRRLACMHVETSDMRCENHCPFRNLCEKEMDATVAAKTIA